MGSNFKGVKGIMTTVQDVINKIEQVDEEYIEFGTRVRNILAEYKDHVLIKVPNDLKFDEDSVELVLTLQEKKS